MSGGVKVRMERSFWKTAGKIALVSAIALLCTTIATLVLLAVAAAAGWVTLDTLQDMQDLPFDHPLSFTAAILQTLSFIGAVLLMRACFKRDGTWSLGWKQPGAPRLLAAGMLIGAALITIVFLLLRLAGGVEVKAAGGGTPGLWPGIGTAFVLFGFVAVSEELFSRGYLQGLVTRQYNEWAGIAVSSLLFALLHGANDAVWDTPLPMINLLLAGVLFAVCRSKSGGLWIPIGLHLTWNFLQGSIYGFEVSGAQLKSLLDSSPEGPAYLSGGAFGAEGSIVTSAVLLAAIFAAYRWLGPASRAMTGRRDPAAAGAGGAVPLP